MIKKYFDKKQTLPRWLVVLFDIFITICALALAYIIRFDLYTSFERAEGGQWNNFIDILPYFVFVKGIIFYLFKIHRGLIRHTSVEDIKRIFFASLTFSSLFFLAGVINYIFFEGSFLLPTSVIIIEFLFSIIFTAGSRFTIKVIYYDINKSKQLQGGQKNILIYGAGEGGLVVKKTIEKSRILDINIVGFIDDNPRIRNSRIEGKPIFHTSKLKRLAHKYDLSEVIIAIQNPNQKRVSTVAGICLKLGLPIKRIPSLNKWVNGELTLKQIRHVNISDLLGRDPIRLDVQEIKKELKNQVILITGAAGSIGSEIALQVLKYNPKKVLLFDQWETGLYNLQIDLIAKGFEDKIEVVIGDVRDYKRVEKMFAFFNPSIIYHAAAYKHVPLMEDNPCEAVRTNVQGTYNIADLAEKYEVNKMVMISTDKAVNPTNIMGATKRIAEIYVQTKNRNSTTRYVTTRFGNVLGSNGSVIPLFKKQIRNGGPVTVTHKDVIRYFMTIPEACQLVLNAGSMGKGGEIFMFDMGEPVKIMDLAKKMIKLSGLELGKDINIEVIGLRPGEKLYEELLADEENTIPTGHPQILKAMCKLENVDVFDKIHQLMDLFEEQNNVSVVRLMKEIVPEYVSNNSVYTKIDEENRSHKNTSQI